MNEYTISLPFPPNTIFGIGLFFLIWLFGITVLLLLQNRKFGRLFRGFKVSDLDELIASHANALLKMQKSIDTLQKDVLDLRATLRQTLSKRKIIRYSPFGHGDSMQSFSLALLDYEGEGVVLTSLQTQDGSSRMYGKPIIRGKSEFRLSPEEERAIKEALK